MIVIGLGAGRTGTASLSKLLNSQPGATVFHEVNPACAMFAGNGASQLGTVREFTDILAGGPRARLSVDTSRAVAVQRYEAWLADPTPPRLLGDIAYYYLRYVPELLAQFPETRFVCMYRDRTETVESWLEKSRIRRWRSLALGDWLKATLTRTPYHREYNFWQAHDGRRYAPSPIWDSTFPTMDAPDKRRAIEAYWDAYYQEADRLAERYPERFRIFPIERLSEASGQDAILAFVGVAESERRLLADAHVHQRAVR